MTFPKPFLSLLSLPLFACSLAHAQSDQPRPDADRALSFEKWSGDINVPDPVAISFDNRGRAYVTQTERRRANDLDIRRSPDWVVDDVRFQSVQDRQDFYREQLAPGKWKEGDRVRFEDHNGDGQLDWRDLTVLTERIHLVEDTDGDGTADRIHVFADNFQTEVTGVAAGVLWHDGQVYATVIPDMWVLRDTDGDDVADQRQALAHGFGQHIAYGGHDMHGLKIGPDGKVYWSVGDKGINVTTAEGRHYLYPNQGVMMRCNPDGSDFEVFAIGMRNIQEPAFDQFGNWFGVDNDSDQTGEEERFLYIMPGMDAGWRCNYQYRESGYNPWMAEHMWQPYDPALSQPGHFVPPIRNYISGPAGFVFNPGTALSPAYRDFFILSGAPKGQQRAFRVEADGASFAMVDDHMIGEGLPIAGLNFAPDGGLYGVDWGNGSSYDMNEKGYIWKIDDPRYAESPARQETQSILREGFSGYAVAALIQHLGHADQRVRLGAQFELAKRKDPLPLIQSLGASSQIARIHSIWGLGQLARAGDANATQALTRSLEDNDLEIRVQAVKTLGDLTIRAFDSTPFLPLLASPDPRLILHTAVALSRQPHPDAVEPLIQIADTLQPSQTYLRAASANALASCASSSQLAALSSHANPIVRAIAVSALRGQRSPQAATFLADSNPDVAADAARAIHDDFSIIPALPDLAAALGDPRSPQSEAFIRRAINANFRFGAAPNSRQVAQYAVNEAAPQALRLEALSTLTAWLSPHPLDRVTGRYRVFDSERQIADLSEPIAALLASADTEIRVNALGLATRLEIAIDPDALLDMVRLESAPASIRVESLAALAAKHAPQLGEAIQTALQSDASPLRIRALQLFAKTDPVKAAPLALAALSQASDPLERQGAASLLAALDDSASQLFLANALSSPTAFARDPHIQLDLLEAADLRAARSPAIAQALRVFNDQRQAAQAQDSLALFGETLEGGNPSKGQKIFEGHLSAQCVRCHTLKTGKGSDIGPNLKKVGTMDKRYVLRALIEPAADIAAGYGAVSATLKNQKTVAGILIEDTPERLVIRAPDGQTTTIAQSEVASRTPAMSLMPPMGYILSKREIRDLMAYLESLK